MQLVGAEKLPLEVPGRLTTVHWQVMGRPLVELAVVLSVTVVFGVTVRGGLEGARTFVNSLRVFSRMTGIGDTRSMVLHPRTATHATFAPEINDRLGVTDGLLRLSIGLESVDDLIADLRHALDAVARLG